MTLKLFNLNIQKGRCITQIIEYLKQNDFDIVHLQEVTGRLLTFDKKTDCFKKILSEIRYQGINDHHWGVKNDPASYLSNATFLKKEFIIEKKEIVWLKKYFEVTDPDYNQWQNISRAALSLTCQINSKKIVFINTHLAWSPTSADTPHKLRQGKILYHYLKNLEFPFVLTGDFNVNPQTKLVSLFNQLGRNLITENKIKNTLNPCLHIAQEIFPKGVAVDYIFVEKSIEVKKFKLIHKPDLSDHYGLAIEIEI